MPRSIDLNEYIDGVLEGSRSVLARAITLVESTRTDHRAQAQRLLNALLPHSGNAHRVGITGVPGVGKSTFIESLGSTLTATGHRVAVLAVDPSSTRSGGSILGDKTRMARLASDPAAFVRPSASAGTLGGVAKATRETMILMEAAGFDVVLVETVGVGQSEITVAGMVDCFLLLTLARSGDQLQGIKKGVLELADIVAVNKADGEHAAEARKAAGELRGALRMIRPVSASWTPPVLACSSLESHGTDAVWEQVVQHRSTLAATGELAAKRRAQQVEWTWSMVREGLMAELTSHPRVQELVKDLEVRVSTGEITPTLAADELLAAFHTPASDSERIIGSSAPGSP
jgi:LAO/AO transport system kinase